MENRGGRSRRVSVQNNQLVDILHTKNDEKAVVLINYFEWCSWYENQENETVWKLWQPIKSVHLIEIMEKREGNYKWEKENKYENLFILNSIFQLGLAYV